MGCSSSFSGIPARFRGITARFRGKRTDVTEIIIENYHYYAIAFIEAYLYNISLGAKPTWHGRNIRVTPKNAITARICWAFFVL